MKIMTKKLGGTNTLLVPSNLKVGGDLSPPVPMVVAPMLRPNDGKLQLEVMKQEPHSVHLCYLITCLSSR